MLFFFFQQGLHWLSWETDQLCFFFSQMSSVGITESVKGDIKKFEIWYNGREEVYIVQVQDTKNCVLLTT